MACGRRRAIPMIDSVDFNGQVQIAHSEQLHCTRIPIGYYTRSSGFMAKNRRLSRRTGAAVCTSFGYRSIRNRQTSRQTVPGQYPFRLRVHTESGPG